MCEMKYDRWTVGNVPNKQKTTRLDAQMESLEMNENGCAESFAIKARYGTDVEHIITVSVQWHGSITWSKRIE